MHVSYSIYLAKIKLHIDFSSLSISREKNPKSNIQ